jgi:trimethylamine--corrinoid protein Co-methyltransferase
VLVALQSGANLAHDVGYLEAGLASSPEMMVFTCEMIGMLRRFGEGITIDEESLAQEVIHAVGPGGNFLAEEHTLRHFREFWQPTLFNRQRFTGLEQESGELSRRVRARTVELMDQACGAPLPASLQQEVDYILGLRPARE